MPIFGDPWEYQSWRRQPQMWTTDRTWMAASTQPYPSVPADEDQIRRIVRQELADLMPVDVPDFPPEP